MPQGVPRPKGIGTCSRNNASRLRISGALHLGIPYPVRDKLLNSLPKMLLDAVLFAAAPEGGLIDAEDVSRLLKGSGIR